MALIEAGGAAEVKQQLLASVLDAQGKEFAELSAAWRSLDTKAQGAVAVAGIFIAGALAFAKDLAGHATGGEKVLLSVAIAALVAAVAAALLTLHVRRAPLPPLGQTLHEMVSDLLRVAAEDELKARAQLLVSDEIRLWSAVNAELRRLNESKALRLRASQWLLLGASVAFAVLAIFRVLG